MKAPEEESAISTRSAAVHAVRVSLALVLAPPLSLVLSTRGVEGQSTSAPRSTTSIAATARSATATLLTLDASGDTLKQGSGFFVRASGELFTNYHVLAGASQVVVTLASGERFDRALVLDADSARDLALLRVSGVGFSALPLHVDLPAVGSKIVVVGSPLGLSQTVSEGIVSAHRLLDGQQVLQITAAISPGSSGGPVFDERGRVVGVASWNLPRGQDLNFAVPAKYAIAMMRDAGSPRSVASVFGQTTRTPRQVVDANEELAREPEEKSSAPPAPTKNVRPSFAGAYSYEQLNLVREAGKTPWHTRQVGLLLISQEHEGLLAWWRADRVGDSIQVSHVPTALTSLDGQVGITMHGLTYDGYQTDDGAYLTSADSVSSYVVSSRVWLVRTTPSLTNRNGIYGVSTRTQYESLDDPSLRGDVTDWEGEMLAMVAHEKV